MFFRKIRKPRILLPILNLAVTSQIYLIVVKTSEKKIFDAYYINPVLIKVNTERDMIQASLTFKPLVECVDV